ncbi:class I SAM-dependent DNA methyltransferase, partial [Corynebacterium sp. HMSC056E09]|uniref:HsdM family class I SAM-dependent methyltransferase n=1 Tax=Corynebacterium sp. HMSC056E09 TaxID=1739416 RepID=UPI000ACF2F73
STTCPRFAGNPTKPLVVAGCLIALTDPVFRLSYKQADVSDANYTETDRQFGKQWVAAIDRALHNSNIPHGKTRQVVDVFKSAVETSPALLSRDRKIKKGKKTLVDSRSVLCALTEMLEDNVFEEMQATQGYDVLGDFYSEFLRYAGGGDGKDLGIVLTPPHVTELFALLADVDENSVVLDPCAGTAGFLIAAMERMAKPRSGIALTDEQLDSIKRSQLIGIEMQPNLFALAASNMLLRGDGKSNLFLGSCFDERITSEIANGHRNYPDERDFRQPNVVLMNPPYAQGKKDAQLAEAHFILNALNMTERGGTVIAIVPMSVATGQNEWREKILESHTLVASMTMPPELFPGASTQTVTMVFKAGYPHNSDVPTWFARWTDDGFVTLRGRKDLKGRWPGIRDQWLHDFRTRKADTPGYCVSQCVTAHDEWLVEAYMETDYSKVTDEDFIRVLREYAVYQMMKSVEVG